MLHGYKIVAVCVTKIYEDSMRHFISALNAALVPHNWRVMVFTTASDLFYATQSDKGAESIFDLLSDAPIDAAIVFSERIYDSNCLAHILTILKSKQIPLIVTDGSDPDCYNIRFNYQTGFKKVVEHLIDCHGITDFHMISGFENNDFSQEREAIMQRVLNEHGIPFDQSNISYGNFWSKPTIASVKTLIQNHAVPRALVCANDVMAITACTTLIQHGYRIPDDVIVTGFDGINLIRYSAPKITSCMCSYKTLGEKTADYLLRIDNGSCTDATLLVEPELIISESCGCRPINSIDAVGYINAADDNFNRYRNDEHILNEVFSKAQTCHRIEDIPEAISVRLVYDMCCLLKTECTDPTLNPLTVHSSTTFGDQLFVLMDTDVENNIEQRVIPLTELAPRMQTLLNNGVPLIYIALHYADIPIGYLCFHFFNSDTQNYLKIEQTASFLSIAISGFRNVQHQRYLTSVVEDLYQYDALTGLFNRNRFLRKYQQMVDEGAFDHITIVLCDLDGLKYINDTFSHHEGDNAISVVAEALHTVCREGLCCRYGGDELVAVMPDVADPTEIRAKILDQLQTYNQWAKKPYEVSTSIGVYTTTNSDFDTMFAAADKLMYQDKQGKKHRR